MTRDTKVLIVVDKDGAELGPSETFLQSHISDLPCSVYTLIGNPGYRKFFPRGAYLLPRNFLALALRWLRRKLTHETVRDQDTRAMVSFLDDQNIDVVLAEYGPTATTVMEACSDSRVPLIAHFHGWDAYSDYMLEGYKSQYDALFRIASVIIAVSAHMKQQLISLGAPPEKVVHNACGADIKHGHKANPGSAGNRFVMVGRLTYKKAPLTTIEAFFMVRQKYPDATLDIVGDGPLLSEVKERINRLGLESAVILHGSQPHEFVISVLSKARCFVQHSVAAEDGDHEGTPVGVLEAMVMGLPIVSTKHGGIMDVIEDGVTGFLVEEHDLEAMAEKMMSILASDSLATSIGENAALRASEQYTSEVSVSKLWAIIQSCVEPDEKNR